ncbi:DUF2815 family protein [Pullulanibacillus sp. KACC 23026]|uniref:DUF2815 family protein n=1 Tax=Pullulanibacillus sp. KACC 23026 TaxID=3028315 RepID=UPI0023B0421C|nr:DUF2815 family protein [Pullulanibacillus sp. KACC 23026]WEG14126.1 DUF2815 family protein [Pullulanibacillus sp. KACC 23026]
MTNQSNPTRVVTGEVRFSFVSLLKPREDQFGGKPKYSATILLPKSDIATKQRIDAAIEAAKEKGKSSVWNGVVPPVLAIPIHDGDGVKPSDGTEFGPECKGHWVFTATTGVDYPPKVVDASLNPIIDQTEVYSGMYGKIAINFSPYMFTGKKGVGCYISTNVQKTRDGDPLGGSAPAAQDDFGFADQHQQAFNQQYPPQQQQYQQPQQQYQAPPQQSYGQQQQYQQAPQQQYQQPQQQPQQPQFDPITGQPINNGGVYGI